MRDLSHSLKNHGLQSQVRRCMKNTDGFAVSMKLPDELSRKLAELDRVFAARAQGARS